MVAAVTADILLGSAIIKRACYCVNGLCTPFGSPVIGGQKHLGRMFNGQCSMFNK